MADQPTPEVTQKVTECLGIISVMESNLPRINDVRTKTLFQAQIIRLKDKLGSIKGHS